MTHASIMVNLYQARSKPVPMLYLDLDGTVREGKDDPLGRFVNGPEDVRVFPAAVEMMRRWKAGGGRIVGVTNQGGIALGLVSLSKVMAAIEATQLQARNLFDEIAVCPHHPDAPDPAQANCWCRKPNPAALMGAMCAVGRHHPDEIYPPQLAVMIGDRPEDYKTALSAGVRFMWASDWRSLAAGNIWRKWIGWAPKADGLIPWFDGYDPGRLE